MTDFCVSNSAPESQAGSKSPGTQPTKSPLLSLPLELRTIIFRHTLFWNTSPTPEEYYLEDVSGCWAESPSGLLRASKQTRAEVFDLLKNEESFILRVTPFLSNFDSLSSSSLIAQGRDISFRGLPELTIEIWAPYPERPLEVIWIWKHVRQVITQLRKVPRTLKLTIKFVDSSLAEWCVDGKPQLVINEDDGRWDDLSQLIVMFSNVHGFSQVQIELPPSLKHDKELEYLTCHVAWNMTKDNYWKGDRSLMGLNGCTNLEWEKNLARARRATAPWEIDEGEENNACDDEPALS